MEPLCVVFDCDGVLLDSNNMKTEGFGEALGRYPRDIVDRFLAFQRTAFGMSRYRLIDQFFATYLDRPPERGERESILDSFGVYCRDNYQRQPLTDGAIATLEELVGRKIPLFVVSGSDQAELRQVLSTIGLARFFVDVFGSPETKSVNLRHVRSARPASRTVFVGDAKADFLAARENDCDFYYLSTWAADRPGMERLKAEHSFEEIARLPELIPHIDRARI